MQSMENELTYNRGPFYMTVSPLSPFSGSAGHLFKPILTHETETADLGPRPMSVPNDATGDGYRKDSVAGNGRLGRRLDFTGTRKVIGRGVLS